jgi:hypothetical protein
MQDFHIRSTSHYILNASTASHYSPNCIDIHLFFQYQCFWHIKTSLSLRQGYHTSFCCVKPSTHAGLTLRFITHNVQNALTSSYWSQNHTAIHLFFCNWCFWTHQNDWIALVAMHSFCCVKTSIPSVEFSIPLTRGFCTRLTYHNVFNASTDSYYSSNKLAVHLFIKHRCLETH